MAATDQQKIELIMSLRAQRIRDTRVLAAIETVPREMFVPDAFKDLAYADQALPIECGQTLSQPFIVAFMTDRLMVGDRMKVLEVGTGSGYQTAILAQLCRRVYTMERYRTLMKSAEERFKELRLANVTTVLGDGGKGWPAQAPFDRIIVTAAAKKLPRKLLEQLAVGGIMVIPVEVSPGKQELLRITRTEEGFERESLLPVRFVPLVEGIAKGM
ncbi:MAG: protein-L-isoaspartate(D-aspartate) O-methyltransferase [Anderseniella sp.]|jgi:protein-L-isoaspartate(D-aspartate) O-methyltransferase|nr:protein-L-isoaspartate(D-aspartate) O-methyltransferase [Anderseniella sp.]